MVIDDAFIFLKSVGSTEENNPKGVAQASISNKETIRRQMVVECS